MKQCETVRSICRAPRVSSDDPVLLAEAATLRLSLEERTPTNLGSNSPRARAPEQTRPKAP